MGQSKGMRQQAREWTVGHEDAPNIASPIRTLNEQELEWWGLSFQLSTRNRVLCSSNGYTQIHVIIWAQAKTFSCIIFHFPNVNSLTKSSTTIDMYTTGVSVSLKHLLSYMTMFFCKTAAVILPWAGTGRCPCSACMVIVKNRVFSFSCLLRLLWRRRTSYTVNPR